MEKLTVIKVGGKIVEDDASLAQLLKDFANVEGNKVLVHGGGRSATKVAAQLGIESQMVGGRRITDAETLKVVTMVYAGWCSKTITAMLQAHGCNAIGLSGADGNVIRAARRLPVYVESLGSEVDYGYVGDVDASNVNSGFIYSLLERGMVPVLNAINHDGDGCLLNTNADTIASSVAVAMADYKYRTRREVCCRCEECTHCCDDGRLTHEVELIYCFEKEGVLYDRNDDSSVIPEIDRDAFAALKDEGRVAEGMIPKLTNAFKAIDRGVSRVVIKHARHILATKGTVLK
jgi:acetylglutamate kinase